MHHEVSRGNYQYESHKPIYECIRKWTGNSTKPVKSYCEWHFTLKRDATAARGELSPCCTMQRDLSNKGTRSEGQLGMRKHIPQSPGTPKASTSNTAVPIPIWSKKGIGTALASGSEKLSSQQSNHYSCPIYCLRDVTLLLPLSLLFILGCNLCTAVGTTAPHTSCCPGLRIHICKEKELNTKNLAEPSSI